MILHFYYFVLKVMPKPISKWFKAYGFVFFFFL